MFIVWEEDINLESGCTDICLVDGVVFRTKVAVVVVVSSDERWERQTAFLDHENVVDRDDRRTALRLCDSILLID